jgi:hypothetical protein
MLSKLAKAFFFGAVPAAILNVVLTQAAHAAGVDMQVVPGDKPLQVLPAMAFVIGTLVPSVVGILIYAALYKLTPARAVTIFLVLSGIAFVLSFGTIIPQPDTVTFGTKLILALTHVVAAAGLPLGVVKFARPEQT